MLRVGLHENISILFLLAIKTAGSAQKLRVGRKHSYFLFTPNKVSYSAGMKKINIEYNCHN